uniref:Uncharacterized protein n=1 Tax=Anguilla anguilla TaxID=7936 RepID=A0A0E9XTB9_ANGAN
MMGRLMLRQPTQMFLFKIPLKAQCSVCFQHTFKLQYLQENVLYNKIC